MAMVLLPLAGLLTTGLVSGFLSIQRFAVKVSKLRFEIGSFKLSLSTFFVSYASVRLVFVIRRLLEIAATRASVEGRPGAVDSSRGSGGLSNDYSLLPTFPDLATSSRGPSGSLIQQLFVKRMRAERDFWICTFTLFLWFFVWWFGRLLKWHWKSLDDLSSSSSSSDNRNNTGTASGATPTTTGREAGEGAAGTSRGRRGVPAPQPAEIEMSSDLGKATQRGEGRKENGDEQEKAVRGGGSGRPTNIEMTTMDDKSSTTASSSSSATTTTTTNGLHRRVGRN